MQASAKLFHLVIFLSVYSLREVFQYFSYRELNQSEQENQTLALAQRLVSVNTKVHA